ncbi:leucine-rich repeat domain-containing protein [Pseudomonas mediterranea]|uniref:leucine-rich repeat domain-containing protein n=1 Tax=Pseudomonas mediterranea TaxID=183795 RepID=UPI0022340DD9|nr:leucine-rich repeat domain-containing protein [Pseudomonas mediterranea]UZE01725.1 leucine-rich repeat domain-containing protein [Pseudomonas mediterranea]
MQTSNRSALIAHLATAPGDIAARAALYRDLLDTAEVSLEGLRVAAGLCDPAAMAVIDRLNTTPHRNRPGPLLPQLRGLPVDHVALDDAESHWLDALAGLPLRTLILNGPRFSCGPDIWRRLPGVALEHLEISSFARDDDATSLPSLERLRCLKLDTYGEDFDDSFLRQLGGSRLQELSLNRCDDLTDDGLRALSPLKLRSLTLKRAGELTSAGMRHLCTHPLEQLTISSSGAILQDPSWLADMTALRSLSLDDCYASDSLLDAIRDLPIERLSLHSAYLCEDDFAGLEGMPLADLDLKCSRQVIERLDVLHGFPLKHLGLSDVQGIDAQTLRDLEGLGLESLDLSLNEVNWKMLKQLAGLPLKRLNLSFCQGMDGKTLRKLTELGLPLEQLEISGLDLRDADLVCLRDMPLQRLGLYESPWLTDAGVAHLAGLPLRDLTLAAGPGESQLTTAMVPVLERLPLERLLLSNCSGISTEGWDRLARLSAHVSGPGI